MSRRVLRSGGSTSDEAVRIFLDFLDRRDRGEDVPIDDLCRAHPELADALGRKTDEWHAASVALKGLGERVWDVSSGRMARPVDLSGDSPYDLSWATFLEQLKSRGPA